MRMKNLSLLFFMIISSHLLGQDQVTLLSKEDIGKDAIEKTWHQNGQLEFEGSYSYGKKHGTHRWWYENGQLEFEEYYNYGKKHGVFKGWWQNGQLDYEGHFQYNQRDGIWKAYYENGQIRQKTDFILQRKLSETCFTESGDEIDCEESLDGIWWWKDEKCFDRHGDEINCHDYYLGSF